MATEKQYLQHLGEMSFFAGCTKKELERVAQMVTPIAIQAGSTFITEGSVGKEMVIISQGTATVRRGGRKVVTLGVGSVVGELALLLDRPRDASVTADVDGELLVLDRRSFNSLLDDIPGLAKKILLTMAKRMSENSKQL
jgi:CRP/FNR family transcriptional regulator, cyclic AMP receptor protein